jgi:nucleotide-binding universal stress UspA family protein
VFNRILVPLDGSRFGEFALPHALSLASRWGAAIELVTVASPVGGPRALEGVVGDESRERGQALAAAYLEEVEERIRGAGFEGESNRTVMPPGNVANSLVRHLLQVGADLTVMTTHGRGPLGRAWLGSSADAFIRSAPAPVFLVRPEGDRNGERVDPGAAPSHGSPPERILVPLDGSATGEQLLPMVGSFVGPDTTVVLFRVVPPVSAAGSPYLPHVVYDERDHQRVKEAAAEYLEGLAGGLREKGTNAEAVVVSGGQPAVAILEAVEGEGVGLLAMSTSGRGGVARLLLGSVADKVVRGCPVPMLLYRKSETE